MNQTDLALIIDHPLWNGAADGLLVVDGDGVIVAANESFDALFAFESGEAIGVTVETLVPEPDRGHHERLRQGFTDSPVSRTMGASRLLKGQKTNGDTFPINISLSPLTIGAQPYTLGAVRDLTDRVAVEVERAESERQRLIAEDRDRIARELHDSVIQHLFAVGLRLQGLPARLVDEGAIATLNESIDAIDSVIAQVRSSIHGLRQTPSERSGRMQAQVVGIVAEMSELLGVNPSIRFEGEVDRRVDETVMANLLPVLREALSNVGRHADASAVSVVVSVGEEVAVDVTDNGRGLAPGVTRSGLANLEARALALGGSMSVSSATPTGTLLRWAVPNGSLGD